MKRSRPALPVIAIPTTAGTGAETNTYGVITDESVGRKGYVGHESVLPKLAILDPELTLGAAARADRRDRRRRADPLARVAPLEEPEPARRGDRPRDVIRTVGDVAAACRRRRLEPRGAQPDAPRRPLRRRRPADAGPASGAVHAIGHAIGTRGRLAARDGPRDGDAGGLRDLPRRPRSRARPRRGRPRRRRARAIPRPTPPGPAIAGDRRDLLDRVGQRRTLGDAGPRSRRPTRRSPRTPSTTRRSTTARGSRRRPEILAILAQVG